MHIKKTPIKEKKLAEIYTGIYIPADQAGNPDKANARRLVQLQIGRKITTYDLAERPIEGIACRCIGDILQAKLTNYDLHNGETIINSKTGREVVVESLPKKEIQILETMLFNSGIDKQD